MLNYEQGLYVVIEQRTKGPHPLPLSNGFSSAWAYRVLGIYNPSESGECWLIMTNDNDELWYISQRHVRAHKLLPQRSDFRLPLAEPVQRPAPAVVVTTSKATPTEGTAPLPAGTATALRHLETVEHRRFERRRRMNSEWSQMQ